MKAILVIDMPDSCSQCEYLGEAINDDIKACTLSQLFFHKDFDIESGREVICPLKPMPQKKVVTVKRIEDIQSYSITEVADKISAKIILKTDEVFALGWNACLEEIEK